MGTANEALMINNPTSFVQIAFGEKFLNLGSTSFPGGIPTLKLSLNILDPFRDCCDMRVQEEPVYFFDVSVDISLQPQTRTK